MTWCIRSTWRPRWKLLLSLNVRMRRELRMLGVLRLAVLWRLVLLLRRVR